MLTVHNSKRSLRCLLPSLIVWFQQRWKKCPLRKGNELLWYLGSWHIRFPVHFFCDSKYHKSSFSFPRYQEDKDSIFQHGILGSSWFNFQLTFQPQLLSLPHILTTTPSSLQFGQLIHFQENPDCMWNLPIFTWQSLQNIKDPLRFPSRVSDSGNCSVRIHFNLTGCAESTSSGGDKFYIRATGMLMVVKQAHSFCTELKGTARAIQNLLYGALVSLQELISLSVKWGYKTYLRVSCQTECITYWRAIRTTCFCLCHLTEFS